MQNRLGTYKNIILISLTYFVLRLVHLSIIPIFNDEAIYLDWGWRELHLPNALFYSLYDGKQPFLMWVFGIAQGFISDPLIAGRLVSVCAGFMTLLGIYMLAKKVFSNRIAQIASYVYIFIPIFSFFDRQALMESTLAAVGVWSLYALLSLIEKHDFTYIWLLGLTLGTGFFIKATAGVFVVATVAVGYGMYAASGLKNYIQNKMLLIDIAMALIIGCIVLLPLFSQQTYWNSLHMNGRYAYTLSEILHFPLLAWIRTLYISGDISFWHVTPFFFILGIYGIYLVSKNATFLQKLLLAYFGISVGIFILVSKYPSPRYILPFLPFATLFIAKAISNILDSYNVPGKVLICISFTCASYFLFLQLCIPLRYFSALEKVTAYSQKSEYVTSWTSGYGVKDAVDYVKNIQGPLLVGVRVDAGNPENAIFSYLHSSKTHKPVYFDGKTMTSDISQIDCIQVPMPLYFVSRGTQLAGLEKFLVEVKRFEKPEGDEFIGIYRIKSPCSGKTLKINLN